MRGFITRGRLSLDGHLGDVPEMRFTPSGRPVIDMSIAVGGGKGYSARWYKATFWEKNAEMVNELALTKGSAVSVEGNLVEVDTWLGKGGEAKGKVKVGWIDVLRYGKSGKMVEAELTGDDAEEHPSGVVEERKPVPVGAKSSKKPVEKLEGDGEGEAEEIPY